MKNQNKGAIHDHPSNNAGKEENTVWQLSPTHTSGDIDVSHNSPSVAGDGASAMQLYANAPAVTCRVWGHVRPPSLLRRTTPAMRSVEESGPEK